MKAGPSIASFCKAETAIKHIERQTRNEKSELFDCNKTLKELIKAEMIDQDINSVQVEVEGIPHYIRLQTPQISRKITDDDVKNATKNIKHVLQSELYIPDELVKIIVERIKDSQSNTISSEKKKLVLCKHKGKETPLYAENTRKETFKLINDFVDVNNKLNTVKKTTNDNKKEYVDVKKRTNIDVLEALKHTKDMTQQVQIVDPTNGLRQSMILKANVEKKQASLGIRTIVPFIKEAAINSLRKLKGLTPEEFEEEFQEELLELIKSRPFKESSKVKFSKKSSVS